MANTTTIYFAMPNGKKALEINHTNSVSEIEELLGKYEVVLFGYRGEKRNGGVRHSYNTPEPIKPNVEQQVRQLRGVTQVYAL